MRQRRRWFNGSLFATFSVMLGMLKVYQRSGSCLQKIFFMLLYLYMLSLTILSYVIVGLFYAAFSIFIRESFPYDDNGGYKAANVIEYGYLIFLFLVTLLSSAVRIELAETGYKIGSVFMGIFAVLMVYASVKFALEESATGKVSVAMIGIYMLTYLMPLLLNCNRINLPDFLKGVIYVIFLSPTFINIITIYAISNIHTVNWGTRPAVEDKKSGDFKKAEAKKETLYKNFRSNFLIIWLMVNITVCNIVLYFSRESNRVAVFLLAGFLTFVIGIKLISSFLFIAKSWCQNKRISKKQNDFFTRDLEAMKDKPSLNFQFRVIFK